VTATQFPPPRPPLRTVQQQSWASLTGALAGVIIALSALARLVLNINGYYLLDDFAFLGRAARPDALSWSVLTEPHLGHLMPAGHMLTWLLQAVAPWNYAVPAVLMSCGWLACLVLMYSLLTRWLGRKPVVVFPLLVYALTPLTVQTTTWWAAAVNAIPLQICALLGAHLLLPLAQGQRRLTWPRQAAALACLLVALAFFSKAVLLPVLFFGLAYAWAPGRGLHALRQAWRSAPVLWSALGVAVFGYLASYWLALGDGRPRLGATAPLDFLGRAAQSISGALVPSWAGGPVEFTPGADPWSVPPAWVTGLGVAALVGCVVLAVRGSASSRRLALVAAAYAAGCVLMLTVGRQAFIEVSSGALRYFADWSIPATLLVASLARDALGNQPTTPLAWRWVAAGLCALAFTLVSIVTTIRLADNAEARIIRAVAVTSLESIRAETSGPILDQWAPSKLLVPLYGDYARSSWMYANVPGGQRFADQGNVLRAWDETGRLVSARVEGPAARSTAVCPSGTDTIQRLTLEGVAIPFTHVVEVQATSQVPTEVQISIGGGPRQAWHLPGGEVTAFRVQVAGGSREVVVETIPGSGACVSSVRVGAAVPIRSSQ
jgi:hypothetical protein